MGKTKGKEKDTLLCSLETKQGVWYLTVKACSKTLWERSSFKQKQEHICSLWKDKFYNYKNERKGVDVRKGELKGYQEAEWTCGEIFKFSVQSTQNNQNIT